MIWHVVHVRHGVRSHALVYDFISGHRVGWHGPIGYCAPLDDVALALPDAARLPYVTQLLEYELAAGHQLRGNNLGGFKWTTDIRTSSRSGSAAAEAKPTSLEPGQSSKLSDDPLPG